MDAIGIKLLKFHGSYHYFKDLVNLTIMTYDMK